MKGIGDLTEEKITKEAQALIEECEKFCARWNLSDSRFGVLALGNDRILPRLRDGLDVRLSTVSRLRDFMAGYAREKLSSGRRAKRPLSKK